MSLIRFIFTGDTTGLTDAGKRAKATLSDLKKEFREGVSTSAKWGAAVAAAGAAVSIHLVKNSLEAIDAQAKLARSLNTTIQGLDVTTKAAGLSGVALEKVTQASSDLQRRLSQAAAGTGPAIDALKRLNLTAEDLIKLPLDQRIATINQALADFVPKAQQAAVAGQLFGEEGSLAITRIDPSTLREAAKEADRFGLALSSVDAAQVEAANDAMSKVTDVVRDLVDKFTAELAPVLTALSNQFLDAAEKGGGLSDKPVSAFNTLTKTVAFTMDAVEGLKRTFEVAGQGIAVFALSAKTAMLAVAEAVVQGPIDAINKLINLVNSLPGDFVDLPTIQSPDFLTGIQAELDISKKAVAEGWAGIQATLAEPLPGGQFLKFVEEAKAAGKEAAESIAAAQTGSTGEGGPVAPTFSDAERDAIAARLEAVRAAHESELEALQAKFGVEQEILAEAREAGLLSEQQYKAELLEVEQDFQDEQTRLNKEGSKARQMVIDAENKKRLQAVGQALGDLSTLMNSESRKMFEVGKAAAIAQTVMSTYEGAQKAFTSLAGIPIVGPALGAAAAAAAIAGGVARVQSIRSQSFGGGGAPSVSNTQAVNNASTPVGGGAGGGGAEGPTYHLTGLDTQKNYSGRDVAAMLETWREGGGRFSWES